MFYIDTKKIGVYSIDKYISKGGMAHVVLASSEGKRYALKIARTDYNSDKNKANKNSLKKEVEVLRKIEHPRVVKVYPLHSDFIKQRQSDQPIFYSRTRDSVDAPWYFVMEYLAGGTLDKYINKCGPLTMLEAVNIIGNISIALEHLLKKEIVHNDIKAENIMFREKIQKGKPYNIVLIDFGTAEGKSNFKNRAGSWFCMSPERVRIAKKMVSPEEIKYVDPEKSELWSLGILFYQMLTKSLPFSSSLPFLDKKHELLIRKILNSQPKSISSYKNTIPLELDEYIVHKCLAKEPENRPTIKEFLEFIKKYRGQKISAISIKDNYYD